MNIVLCDDRAEEIERYSAQIRKCASRHGEPVDIRVFASGDNLLFHLEDKLPGIDLMYLDIHMAGMDGMRTAQTLRKLGYVGDIVFLTVDRERVFDAFDVEALQYLLKETADEVKFDKTFAGAMKRAARRRQEYISLSCAGETLNIAIDDILYFSLENRIITLHYLKEGKEASFEFYSTLEKLENTLAGCAFGRNRRNQLVSIRMIQAVRADEILLKNGGRLNLSARRVAQIRELCATYHIEVS